MHSNSSATPANGRPTITEPTVRPRLRPRRVRRASTLWRSLDPNIPGPAGLPGVGVLPRFTRDPFESVRGWAEEYGDVFHVPVPLWNLVMVNHPDLVDQVMNDRDGHFSMIGPAESIVARTIGASLPMMEGERFRRRRRTLTPMFGRRHLARIAESVADEFVLRLERWKAWADTGRVVDLQHEISQVTLPAFLRAMYSTSVTDEKLAELDRDLRLLMRTVAAGVLLSPPPNPLPMGSQSLPLAWRRLRRTVEELIDERVANPIDGTDLLGLLLEARYDDGSAISRKDLAMELIVLMAGGYETVVASLSHTLAHLCLNPEPTALLYEEVDALDGAVPTLDDLGRLTWAKACFDEGQRLQGHPMNPRAALSDTDLGGFHIPRGTLVGTPVYTLHRDQRWWTDPDAYDPTRFADREAVMARPNLAFIPFGAGPHHCIGSGMAYMNAQFLIALIFQRYRLEVPRGWRPRHASTFSITLQGGLPVRLSRR